MIKKIIMLFVILSLIITPVVIKAEDKQVADPTVMVEELRQQLISLIMEQIKILQAQLDEMLAQQKANTKIVEDLQTGFATATAPKKDKTPPVVSFSWWKEKMDRKGIKFLSGNVCIDVGVYDPDEKNDLVNKPISDGFDRFEFYVDNFLMEEVYDLKSLNDCISVDTTRFGNGSYTFLGKAWDKANNKAEDSFVFEVKN